MKKFKLFGLLATTMILTAACNNADKPATAETTDNTAAVIENIMTRCSVRQFTDKAVPADTLEQLVRAGMAAPTAMNKQPWAFVIVNEREVLDSLATCLPWAHLEGAQDAIIVCGDLTKAEEGEAQEFWIQDCSAASENILLAAHAYGLGAVWCAAYPGQDRVDGVRRVLGLPETIVPLNSITLGYPTGENEIKDKWVPDNVHYNKW